MEAWNLTAKTVMHVDEWRQFFNDIGYTGDYYWFIPQNMHPIFPQCIFIPNE